MSSDVPTGLYELPRRSGEAHYYRLSHPLAEWVLSRAKARSLEPAEIVFDYDNRDARITALEPFRGRSGQLVVSRITIEALDRAEDHLLLAARVDGGELIPAGTAARLFSLPASLGAQRLMPRSLELDDEIARQQSEVLATIASRNGRFFDDETRKLDDWADDLKVALEREIKDMDRQIREARRAASRAGSLEGKLEAQRQIKALEGHRNSKRKSLFEAQDQIDGRREQIIRDIESRMTPFVTLTPVVEVAWRLS